MDSDSWDGAATDWNSPDPTASDERDGVSTDWNSPADPTTPNKWDAVTGGLTENPVDQTPWNWTTMADGSNPEDSGVDSGSFDGGFDF